jgi:hypothetical protein
VLSGCGRREEGRDDGGGVPSELVGVVQVERASWREGDGADEPDECLGDEGRLFRRKVAESGMALYVSAGNGVPCDQRDVNDIANPHSKAGLAYQIGIEPALRASTESFLRVARRQGVPVSSRLSCGLHSWRY